MTPDERCTLGEVWGKLEAIKFLGGIMRTAPARLPREAVRKAVESVPGSATALVKSFLYSRDGQAYLQTYLQSPVLSLEGRVLGLGESLARRLTIPTMRLQAQSPALETAMKYLDLRDILDLIDWQTAACELITESDGQVGAERLAYWEKRREMEKRSIAEAAETFARNQELHKANDRRELSRRAEQYGRLHTTFEEFTELVERSVQPGLKALHEALQSRVSQADREDAERAKADGLPEPAAAPPPESAPRRKTGRNE